MRAILILIFMVHAMAAFGQSSTPADTLKIGIPGNAADKGFIFDTADGGSNKSLKIEKSTKLLKFDGNAIQIGDGALTSAKEIKFNGTSGKVLKYDHTNTEFSINDDLAIDAGQKLKTNSIDTKSGTTTSVEQDLRAKGKLFLGASGTVQLRENSGKLEFSNDGSVYKKVGSGGGGAGATSILENGGFEDGITSLWSASVGTATALSGTSNALIGETSVSFDPAALNDYLRTSYITIPKGLRGTACEARFLYDGGDALNYSAKVETESGVILGTFNSGAGTNVLPIHSFPGYESVFFKCPTEADVTALSTNGNIRLVIYQGTAVSATVMKVDDVHLGGLIGLVETSTADGFGFIINGSTAAITATDNQYPYSCNKTGTGQYNCSWGVTFTSSVTCVLSHQTVTQGDMATSGTQVFFTTRNQAGTLTDSTATNIFCKKNSPDNKQSIQVYKSIPKVSANVNSYPFILSTGASGTAPTVLTDTLGIISSFTKTGTGTYNIGYSSLALAWVPTLVCTTTEGYLEPDSVTVSSAGVITRNAAGTGSDLPNLWIFCNLTKNNSDFKMPTVQPIVIGQVTNSAAESGLVNVRTEACHISNSGTASIVTSSGTCDWLLSATRSGVGQVDLVIKTGYFSMIPICTANLIVTGISSAVQVSITGVSTVTTLARGNAGAAGDFSFGITCMGRR